MIQNGWVVRGGGTGGTGRTLGLGLATELVIL
jgi:hypothetical protein